MFNGAKATCSHWFQNKEAVNKAGEEKQGGRARMCLDRKEWKKWEEWRMEAWLQGFSVTGGVGLQQSTVIAVYFGHTDTHTACCVRSPAVKALNWADLKSNKPDAAMIHLMPSLFIVLLLKSTSKLNLAKGGLRKHNHFQQPILSLAYTRSEIE